MTTHLALDIPYDGSKEHPQHIMKRLGISYQHSTPQSIADQWWFWNCENIPDPLPKNIRVLDITDPAEMISYGLSKEIAEKIRDYTSPSQK